MPETTLEERIAGLEGSYKELTKRIDDLREETHRGLDLLRAETNALRGEVNGLRAEISGVRGEISGVRGEMNSTAAQLRAEIRDLRVEFRSSFRWTMSLVLINWLSVLAAIFLVAGKR